MYASPPGSARLRFFGDSQFFGADAGESAEVVRIAEEVKHPVSRPVSPQPAIASDR